jgi:hypothetical protein
MSSLTVKNNLLNKETGIGKYLKNLQLKLEADAANSRKSGESFSSTLFLLKWLNKNTNIDLEGLNEIFNGGYTVIENDYGELYNEICKLANNTDDKKRGTAPDFVSGPKEATPPQSSHYSCPKNNKCKTPENKSQIRMGQGVLYACENGLCTNKSSSVFDLIIGVRCNDDSKINDNNSQGNTWFQFEYARLTGNSKMEALSNKYLLHVYSFLCYIGTFCTENQGTFGTSLFVESGPHYRLLMKRNAGDIPGSSIDEENKNNKEKALETQKIIYGQATYIGIQGGGGQKKHIEKEENAKKQNAKKQNAKKQNAKKQNAKKQNAKQNARENAKESARENAKTQKQEKNNITF